MRSLYADAVRMVACPHCKAKAGDQCRTKRGYAKYAHSRRLSLWREHPDYDESNYVIKVENVASLFERLLKEK